ncbi:hypothetical protein Salmuc_01797 [Salipiger mucosus DSM 16094]|uniref:Uncharacterized protein n=2 Tax=Salipiger mucosus TaxID=263378 RepID=S9QWR5_9RHOB|nr:hypothetical protein Salmuc_01797 [Salipiger mucosus DSM 16094]
MEVVERNGSEALKVKGGAEQLPQRLIELQRALEAFDAAEGDLAESDITTVYRATHLILKQIRGRHEIKGDPAKVLAKAFELYGGHDWIGRAHQEEDQGPARFGLRNALSSSDRFRTRAMAKARADIERREEQQALEDDARDPFAPGAGR